MKTQRINYIIIILISLITFISCDIQKKRYSRGYTVNWKKNYAGKTKIKITEQTKTDILPSELVAANEVGNNAIDYYVDEQDVIVDDIDKEEDVFVEESVYEETDTYNEVNSTEETKTNNLKNNKLSFYSKTKKRQKLADTSEENNKLAISAIILSLFFFLLLIPLVLSIIFSIIALIQIKRRPNQYKTSSKGLAISALCIDFFILLILFGLIFSFQIAFVVILIFAMLIGLMISLVQPKDAISQDKPKRSKKEKKRNQFWLKNRLLALFILVFGALLLLPLI